MARRNRGSRLTAPEARIAFTPGMKKRLTRRALAMIERSLALFPELRHHPVTIGYTLTHLGSASVTCRAGGTARLAIRLKVNCLSYQTIGHELTHLVQGLARGGRHSRAAPIGKIPGGEKQCDIWTLARSRLFCDDPPTYLRLPRVVRQRWHQYAGRVRRLCIRAIAQRPARRCYIRWLETEIRKLARVVPPGGPGAEQLALPFGRAARNGRQVEIGAPGVT
ncbi:MAG TPA: hypothetical protein VNN77_07475 [candidate division Zixibacteria bacterium]|nr:hypothetical protein [candidate division Zixibacteria bacterium]